MVTDDGHQLILRVQQEGNKAITTPLSNAQIGEYFRNRLGLANGAYVWKKDLEAYGRTDVTFYKLDDEQFYMDFLYSKTEVKSSGFTKVLFINVGFYAWVINTSEAF